LPTLTEKRIYLLLWGKKGKIANIKRVGCI
jgi:hypothetical protein